MARTQGVENVLNPKFAPSGTDQVELFQAQQFYMYSVFERAIQFSYGKSIVRFHEVDFDAQLVYKKTIDYLKKSTKGVMAATDIL